MASSVEILCAREDTSFRSRRRPQYGASTEGTVFLVTVVAEQTNLTTPDRPTARRSLPALEPVSEFCWQPLESQQHNQPERRSDEFDADVVSLQPRFLLQELIFAHCPYQPRRPIRGNSLTKSDWPLLGESRHRVRHLANPNRSQLRSRGGGH